MHSLQDDAVSKPCPTPDVTSPFHSLTVKWMHRDGFDVKILRANLLRPEQPSKDAAKAIHDHHRSPESDGSSEQEQIDGIAFKTELNPTDEPGANEA